MNIDKIKKEKTKEKNRNNIKYLDISASELIKKLKKKYYLKEDIIHDSKNTNKNTNKNKNENIITPIPSPTEQEHKVKFVDFNIKNSCNAKFTGIFNNERIESNNRFNRLVIYWAYKYLYDKNFDKLDSNIKTTVSKTKKESNYRNEYSNKYYVSNSDTKCIWINIMNIKNIAKSKKIEFNLENVYVKYHNLKIK